MRNSSIRDTSQRFVRSRVPCGTRPSVSSHNMLSGAGQAELIGLKKHRDHLVERGQQLIVALEPALGLDEAPERISGSDARSP